MAEHDSARSVLESEGEPLTVACGRPRARRSDGHQGHSAHLRSSRFGAANHRRHRPARDRDRRSPRCALALTTTLDKLLDRDRLLPAASRPRAARARDQVATLGERAHRAFQAGKDQGKSLLHARARPPGLRQRGWSEVAVWPGESGTGKELVARSTVAARCWRGPFVAINCWGTASRSRIGALQQAGHSQRRDLEAWAGCFEQANGGTPCSTRSAMSLTTQASLPRTLQEDDLLSRSAKPDKPDRRAHGVRDAPRICIPSVLSRGRFRE